LRTSAIMQGCGFSLGSEGGGRGAAREEVNQMTDTGTCDILRMKPPRRQVSPWSMAVLLVGGLLVAEVASYILVAWYASWQVVLAV
jgi:hypothetical protein